MATSLLCMAGGIIQVGLVKDGPALPKGSAFNLKAMAQAFAHPGFRASSLGYFGHMWELYALWAFIPIFFQNLTPKTADFWTVAFFFTGFLGCSLGGLFSVHLGSQKIARLGLAGSASCCLLSPFLPNLPLGVTLGIMMFWGLTVTADSPQFSSLNARFAPKAYVGSALTIVNCLGFLITIFTIELLGFWIRQGGLQYAFLLLAPGPLAGWMIMKRFPVGN